MSRCDKKKWAVADLNSDDVMQLSEYYAFNFPWMYEFMHELLIECALSEWDLDGDEQINVEEFAWINVGHLKGVCQLRVDV